jgi:homogentisate 1,2-dioxygenase
MVDTFRPLYYTDAALAYLDENYPMSWQEKTPQINTTG